MCKNVWSNFELDFKHVLEEVLKHSDSLEAEIRLANQVDIRKSFGRQLDEQKKAGEAISRIEVGESAPFSRLTAFMQLPEEARDSH